MIHADTHPGSWMLTSMANTFDLRTPAVGSVVLADLAHSLAQISRYTGHACRPISVAEHSLLVVDILQRLITPDVHASFAALMHDAHEAYCNDLSPMAKALLGDAWQQLEGRCQATVRTAFALHGPCAVWAGAIKEADMIALATERQQLLPPGGPLWPSLLHVQPVQWVDLMAPERVAMTWADWRDRFKDAADELDFARNDTLYSVRAAS